MLMAWLCYLSAAQTTLKTRRLINLASTKTPNQRENVCIDFCQQLGKTKMDKREGGGKAINVDDEQMWRIKLFQFNT